MGDKAWEADTIFDVFGDSLARRILVIANQDPVSAEELTTHLDASPPTIYRRVNALTEYNLLTEDLQVADDGNHYKQFETTLDQIEFDLQPNGYDVNVSFRQDLVNRFEAFWDDLEQSSPEISLDTNLNTNHRHRQSEGYDG